jgi:hypothetical protein
MPPELSQGDWANSEDVSMAAKISADLAYMGDSDGSGMSFEFQVLGDQKSARFEWTTRRRSRQQPNDRLQIMTTGP